MPRDLKASERNKLTITDAIGGGDIELYYRNPTTEECVQFQSESVRKVGGKIRYHFAETRIKYGLRVLTGFRHGDFIYDGKPLSSDPSSADYREDWKALLKETAADIVIAVGFAVFESTSSPRGAGDAEEEGDDALPL